MHFSYLFLQGGDPTKNKSIALVKTGASAAADGSDTLLHGLQELLVLQFKTAQSTAPAGLAGDDPASIKMPFWLRGGLSGALELSLKVSVGSVASLFVTSGANPVIPNLSALTDGPSSGPVAGAVAGAGAGAGAGGAGAGAAGARGMVTPVSIPPSAGRDAQTQFKDAVDAARRSDAMFAERLAAASEQWKNMEVGEVGAVADELQQVFTSALFPSNRFTRRRPDYSGPSLSTRGLIR